MHSLASVSLFGGYAGVFLSHTLKKGADEFNDHGRLVKHLPERCGAAKVLNRPDTFVSDMVGTQCSHCWILDTHTHTMLVELLWAEPVAGQLRLIREQDNLEHVIAENAWPF